MVAASRLDDTHDAGGAVRVFLALRDRVVSGELKAGDRLLPERELSLRFDVPPTAAARGAALAGDARFSRHPPRQGRLCAPGRHCVLSDFLTFCLAQQPDMLDDMMQARIAIECQAIRLACDRATEGDLKRIGSPA